MAREGGGRFEFGCLGILGMFAIFTAGSVVIFFLGIYVGKGLQESRLAREERVVRLPVNPGDGAGDALGDSDLRLYDQLAQAPPSATSSVNLAVRSAEEPVATATPAPVATAEPEASPTPLAMVRLEPEPTRAAAPPSPAAEVARAEPLPTARPASGKTWSVQVNATKDAATAERIVERLNELGYQAFIVRVRLADETWYRVRVGRFPTMEAATAVVMRLKNEERYSRAFLVNE